MLSNVIAFRPVSNSFLLYSSLMHKRHGEGLRQRPQCIWIHWEGNSSITNITAMSIRPTLSLHNLIIPFEALTVNFDYLVGFELKGLKSISTTRSCMLCMLGLNRSHSSNTVNGTTKSLWNTRLRIRRFQMSAILLQSSPANDLGYDNTDVLK